MQLQIFALYRTTRQGEQQASAWQLSLRRCLNEFIRINPEEWDLSEHLDLLGRYFDPTTDTDAQGNPIAWAQTVKRTEWTIRVRTVNTDDIQPSWHDCDAFGCSCQNPEEN